MGMASPTYWTAELVRELPDDGNRYEVVCGELLVTPAPRAWHQVLVGRILVALHGFLEQEPVGYVFPAPADISLSLDTLVQPDVFVVPLSEARTLRWDGIRTLLLAVEVLSPSSARADRFTKRRWYQEAGVPVYWILDGEAHSVEVWTPEAKIPGLAHDRLVWHPAGAAREFTQDLQELFRPL